MTIIGFNFTELSVKREAAAKGKVSVNNKINITDVKEQQTAVAGKDSKVSKIDFELDVTYEPNVGSMKMTGSLAYLAKNDAADAMSKQWSEKKSLPEAITKIVMKQIIEKGMMQAIILSKDVNLPSPVPLPKLGATTKA